LTEKNTDFQHIIFNLQQFWVEQGAVLWQPYYSQVGAGTMNPATFLRVLGYFLQRLLLPGPSWPSPTITLSTPARSLGTSPPFGSATSVSKSSGK
jgi:hypothetical protein